MEYHTKQTNETIDTHNNFDGTQGNYAECKKNNLLKLPMVRVYYITFFN